jgi:protein-tyrosine phosphatase
MDMTRRMLAAAKAAGVDAIVATPHFRQKDLPRRHILKIFEWTKVVAQKSGIRLCLGYEVHVNMLARMKLEALSDFCIQDTNVVLLEFDSGPLPPNWDVLLCDLVCAGYRPVIVHPERIRPLQNEPGLAMEMRGYGCELQVDAQALHGLNPFFSAHGRLAGKLFGAGLIDYIASDAHRPSQYRDFARVLKRLDARFPKRGWLDQLAGRSASSA